MARHSKLLLCLIILASGGLYLLGNGSVALWDRDEPRYAQTSRQMLQSGDWVVPHYLDNIRAAKPAFIYWCQAAAMEVFGDNAFAARFPSVVAVTILLILLSFVFWRAVGPVQTVWTVFILATSGLVIASAKMCITDAVLLLFVTIGQLCLYLMWRGRFSWPTITIFAIATALAGLTKGPVVLGFQATTLLALLLMRWIDKRFAPIEQAEPRDISVTIVPDKSKLLIKFLVAVLLIAAITLPWILLVWHRSATFLKIAIGHEVGDRMFTALEQHSGPPGYYVVVAFLTFFPWSLLLPLTIGLAIRHRANPMKRFALAAVVGPWIMLECIRTKLPFYFLPVYPPLAFLAGDALVRCVRNQCKDLRSTFFVTVVGIWACFIAAACSAPWIATLAYHGPLPKVTMAFLSVLGPVFGITVFLFFKARRIAAGAVAMGVGTMVLVAVFYGMYFPHADFLRLSPRVADVLIRNGVTQPHQAVMLDYMEPSLAFHQGGTIREAGQIALTRRSVPDFTPWMVVTDDIWQKAPTDIQNMFDIIAHIHGLAYADKARWMDVMVIKRKDSPATSGR